mgnify:CR=1 FL=1
MLPPVLSLSLSLFHRSYWGPSAGWLETPVYLLGQLKAGHQIAGPAIIIDNTSTIVVGTTGRDETR